ncbi:MAG: LTA synthase family protein [Lachnospiraceae bacterium]|nr:LTA synthase family protein [Lachnospiraceae bacterium]
MENEDTSKKKIIVYIIKWVVGIVIPIALFFLMEANTHNAFTEVRPWAKLFNILIFEFMFFILAGITGRLSLAIGVLSTFAAVFGLVNYYVYEFRGTPFVPWDIFSWKTASSVAGNYDFALPIKQLLILAGFIAIMVLCHFILKIKLKVKVRIALGLIGLICLVVLSGRLQNEDFQDEHSLYKFLFTPVFMWNVNGYLVTFDMDLPYITVDKPDGYTTENAISILEGYEDEEETEVTSDAESDYPNIIVIMDEAFSDLSVLGDFDTNVEMIPFVKSLMNGAENTVSGYLNVSVCGGNTANTEFEYLTGNTMRFLPGGSIPYQQYIKEGSELFSLPDYLKSLGYNTYAMHPYKASGWSRDIVYPILGFDDIRFESDMSGLTYLREYTSDSSAFANIIDAYENNGDDAPAFIFQVTMQNHGSYSEEYDNYTPDVVVEGKESAFALSQYLSLTNETDKAFKELIEYFEGEDEDTIIVFFGDHQPNDSVAKHILSLNGLDVDSLTEEQYELRYQVPYIIWANFDIDEESGKDTSVNYLGMQTLLAAGVPLAPYQKLLDELSEYYPIISASRLECEEESELLSDYEEVQYYELFEK